MNSPITRREALRRVAFLMGGAIAAPTAAGILGGCRPDASWQPAILTGHRGELTAAVADRIIPATDTPGARDVGVPQFIDRMLAEWYPDDLRQRFLAGLDDLDERARQDGAASFTDAAAEQQHEILLVLDREAFPEPARPTDSIREQTEGGETLEQPLDLTPETHNKLRGVIDEAAERTASRRPDGGPVTRADVAYEGSLIGDPSFWRMIKELTILGYYSSEAGATEELTYVGVPGRYEACIPFSDVGSTWAT